MPESPQESSSPQCNEIPPEILRGSLGHGMVARSTDAIACYVVAPAVYIPGGEVARYDKDTVLVSAEAPTKPSRGRASTQSELVRRLLDKELEQTDDAAARLRPTFLTEEEARRQIHAELANTD